MIEFLKYVLIGIIQGITEPLPISSSGHIMIAREFMNMPAVDYFLEIFLHVASLIAILILFRKRILELIVGNINYIFKRNKDYVKDFHYALMILIGIIPAGIVGVLFKETIETRILVYGLLAIGISLLVTGSFLLLVQSESTENTRKNITPLDALTVGLFQVVALLPGISRSGSTFVGGLFRKLEFKALVEYSFMLFIPVTAGSLLLEIIAFDGTVDHPVSGLMISFVLSGVLTFFALRWFVNMVKKGNLKYFAYYCFVVGTLSIIIYFI